MLQKNSLKYMQRLSEKQYAITGFATFCKQFFIYSKEKQKQHVLQLHLAVSVS